MRAVIIAVPADLMFAARIRAAAERTRTDVFIARNAKIALDRIGESVPALLIVDLDARGWDPIALIREVKGREGLGDVQVLSYVSHVREDLITAAREAGSKVVARGAFARDLDHLLAGFADPAEKGKSPA